MKKITLISAAIFAYCILQTASCFSQGVAINKTGAAAHTSAMLDVSDTTKGILIPRMTKVNKLAISGPANGLLIYQTDDTTGFWYYNGVKWLQSVGPQGPAGGGSSCAPAGAGETLINYNGCLYVKNIDETGYYSWTSAQTQCASLGTGWYLPGKFELDILFQNWNANGQLCGGQTCPLSGFSATTYWSGTMVNANFAFEIDFTNASMGSGGKANTDKIRCVRR